MSLKSKLIALKMDKKLANQLERYAENYEEGNKSAVARKAIRKYILEMGGDENTVEG